MYYYNYNVIILKKNFQTFTPLSKEIIFETTSRLKIPCIKNPENSVV